ncbi:MAG: endonuclease V [Desulfurococcales archaeon]|nr:endonuclease V [Desulfurococcales archaeon]
MFRFKARKAYKLQEALSRKVIWEGDLHGVRTVVGLDISYRGRLGIAAAALLTYPDMQLLKYSVAVDEVPIPYIPGLLAFREAPLMLAAYEALGVEADLIIVDGHGVTHPRGFGIASHVGVVLDKPSIGAAKKKLTGEVVSGIDGKEYLMVKGRKGAYIYRPKQNKAIYLSIGHRVSLEAIVNSAQTFFKGHTLPEPTYMADRISREVRRRYDKDAGG